jgi:hypothetical protein
MVYCRAPGRLRAFADGDATLYCPATGRGGGCAQQSGEGEFLRRHDCSFWWSAVLSLEDILRLCFAALLTKVLFPPK